MTAGSGRYVQAADRVVVRVIGHPQPQGSMRAITVGGRARVVPGGTDKAKKALAAWRKHVERAATTQATAHGQLDGPLHVWIQFRLPRPRTVTRPWPSVPPDLDKLARATHDALTTSGLIADDGRICRSSTEKVYADGEIPGALIVIQPMEASQ